MSVHSPESVFEKAFAHPALASRLASDLIRRNLPVATVAALDLDRLQRVAVDVVDLAGCSRRPDALYRAGLRDVPGQAVLIPFFLVGEPAAPAWLAPLATLRYALLLWARYVEEARAATGRTPARLPLVLPIVVHDGPQPSSGAHGLSELFDLPVAFAEYLPRFPVLVDDMTVGESERAERRARFLAQWRRMLDASAGEPHHLRVVEASVQYLFESDYSLSPADFVETARAVADPRTKEALMTLGDKFKALGREEGRAEGRTEGRTEGRAEGRAEGRTEGRAEGLGRAVLTQIQLKFGAPDEATRRRVEAADIDQLDRWTARILTAETLAELFADGG